MNRSFTHSESEAKGTFQMWEDDTCIARMTYSRIDEHNVIVDHTVVNPSAKGTGAGKQIVHHLVEWARNNEQKVMPLCPFAKAIIERNYDYHDILRK